MFKQYLTFKLDLEIYAIVISKVREVLDYVDITKVPQMPNFLRGVINLRGAVLPVIDLRIKFGMEEIETTMNTCIIIVDVEMDGQNVSLGLIADSVSEVLDLTSDQIEPPPRMGTRLHTDFINGMGRRNDTFIIILNIDKVLSAEDLELANVAKELSPN